MKRSWGLFLAGCAAILAGCLLASLVQTAGGVRIQDVRFTGTGATPMSALLYIPAHATPKTPAPGILAVHGYINSRETQDGFAIELARRGYVVLALDQTGHGYSGGYASANGFGGPDGLKYLRGLDIVDPANIGLEGHSMGGWTVLAAAKAMPDAYKAVVLEGSSSGAPFAAPGTPTWPRNLAVVFSQYDEFSWLMWNVPGGKAVGASPKLIAQFGASGPVQVGRLYGDIAAGTARRLYTPATTHPGDHISTEAIGDALDWFGQTLKGGAARPVSDQIWPYKELGTGIALAGVIALMLGAFELMLGLPAFAGLVGAPQPGRERRSAGWWASFWLTSLIPPLTFYPFMALGMAAFKPSALFPQSITNQILTWAVLNALLTLVIRLAARRPVAAAPRAPIGPALGVAAATVGVALAAVLIADFVFKLDFRLWVVALKAPSLAQARAMVAYLIPFTAFFVVALGALQGDLSVRGDGRGAQYATAILAMSLGFGLFIIAQYAPLALSDHLLVPLEALNAIISLQFLPLMAAIGLISAYTWRRTGSSLPGALICGLFVTWYMVAGTATQFGGPL